jgi:glycosyltransferase involved in cell wall biosynthesis
MVNPRELVAAIASIAPDVIHTHSGVWLKCARAARMAGVRVAVHTEHGRRAPDPLSDRIIDRFAARYSDAVVVVSERLRGNLIRDVGIPAHKVRLIPNGVDAPIGMLSADDSLRRELGIRDEAPILGSVGRLEKIKGYEIAIRALALLPPSADAPVLVVAGDGAERPALEALARQLRVEDRVFLLGWRDDIARIHSASTLFTMSSHSEGTSVSLLEAMAAGLCPVVTDVGGNAAVLGDVLEHRLVPPGNPAALARAWLETLHDQAARLRDADHARVRVQRFFSLGRMVADYEALYQQLLTHTTAPRLELRHEAR